MCTIFTSAMDTLRSTNFVSHRNTASLLQELGQHGRFRIASSLANCPSCAVSALNHRKHKKQQPPPEEFMFEQGIFKTIPMKRKTSTKEKKKGPFQDGLVPEEWKYVQDELNKTKSQKKKESMMQERENAQLNELKDHLRRQKVELMPTSEQLSRDSRLHSQLSERTQLLELEKVLSARKDPRGDQEGHEMFTEEENFRLKRRTPDFFRVNCDKWPVLHMLASSGQYFFLEQLLNLDVDVNLQDEDGYTALQRAVLSRKETAVTQLVNAGAEVTVCDKDGANLLHISVQTGCLNLVRLFIRHGVDVNHTDKYGWTPLHIAAMMGRDDIVRHLLVSGADRSLQNQDGFTARDIAFALGKSGNSYSVAKALALLSKAD